MRCCSCNRNLNDFESTRKDSHGGYPDLCNKCIKGLGIETTVRADLEPDAAPPADYLDVGEPFLDPINTAYFEDD